MSEPRWQHTFLKGILSLLLLGCLAPACSPKDEQSAPEDDSLRHLILLTNAARWPEDELAVLRDSLAGEGCRVIVSGYPGEGVKQLVERLPWLLQPGVDVLLCDPKFLPATAVDSLRAYLDATGHPAEVNALGH